MIDNVGGSCHINRNKGQYVHYSLGDLVQVIENIGSRHVCDSL